MLLLFFLGQLDLQSISSMQYKVEFLVQALLHFAFVSCWL
jgi:hypothetical protein